MPPVIPGYRPVALRMYRILLKECRILQQCAASSESILLQPRIDPRNIGSSHIISSTPTSVMGSKTSKRSLVSESVRMRESLYSFFALQEYAQMGDDDDAEDDMVVLDEWLQGLEARSSWSFSMSSLFTQSSLWTDIASIRDAIRYAFRNAPAPLLKHHAGKNKDSDDHRSQAFYTKWSIDLYKLLKEQSRVQRLTSVSIDQERSIRIVATSQCVGRSLNLTTRSNVGIGNDDEEGSDVPRYRFAYRIRMENNSSSDRVQLLGRTWIIQETLADGHPTGSPLRVHAPTTGAVGKLPVLDPGQAFEYSSQCELVTPTGEMKVGQSLG
jgi:uncharacterized protein affecting Mg2+/Co2+ transport